MQTILKFQDERALDIANMIYDLVNQNDPKARELLDELSVTLTVPVALLGVEASAFDLTCSIPAVDYLEWLEGRHSEDFIKNLVMANIYNIITMDFDAAYAVIGGK